MSVIAENLKGGFNQRNPPQASLQTSIMRLGHLFHFGNYSALPVWSRGELVGVVTQSDFEHYLSRRKKLSNQENRSKPCISDLLSSRVEKIFLSSDTLPNEIIRKFLDSDLEALWIQPSKNHPHGIFLTRQGLVDLFLKCLESSKFSAEFQKRFNALLKKY